MIKKSDIAANVTRIIELGDGVLRFEDVLPRKRIICYLRMGGDAPDAVDLVTISENNEDDDFAASVLGAAIGHVLPDELVKLPLSTQSRPFDSVLTANPRFHAYFEGRLDVQRSRLVLCLPIHHSEFTGKEDRDTFATMRREVVPTLDWSRDPVPRALVSSNNPRSGGGTGNRQMLFPLRTLERQIADLNGVDQGFIEITNYREAVIELLSPRPDVYIHIRDRDDSTRRYVTPDQALGEVRQFLLS